MQVLSPVLTLPDFEVAWEHGLQFVGIGAGRLHRGSSQHNLDDQQTH
jgi:hypothetical protein